jgi:hypothetical protein
MELPATWRKTLYRVRSRMKVSYVCTLIIVTQVRGPLGCSYGDELVLHELPKLGYRELTDVPDSLKSAERHPVGVRLLFPCLSLRCFFGHGVARFCLVAGRVRSGGVDAPLRWSATWRGIRWCCNEGREERRAPPLGPTLWNYLRRRRGTWVAAGRCCCSARYTRCASRVSAWLRFRADSNATPRFPFG